MRPLKMLSMLLIGMIGITALATTTTNPEQKQKMEIIKESPTYFVTPVTVVVEYSFVANELKVSPEKNLNSKPSNKKATFYFAVMDVGWQGTEQKNKIIPYTEKLLKAYNLPFKGDLPISANRIRSNC